jgi:hypothetical protein
MANFRFSTAVSRWFGIMAIGALLSAPLTTMAQHDNPHQHAEHEPHSVDDNDDFSSPGTHVHGQATLTMVLEGNEAMLQLQSAAHDIVGFEHAPNNAEQRQKVAAALEVLRQGKWFAINAQAGCELSEVDADSDLTSQLASEHVDFYANVSLICQQPSRLNELTVTLFNMAPSLEGVAVQWVINGQQGAADLNSASNRVNF